MLHSARRLSHGSSDSTHTHTHCTLSLSLTHTHTHTQLMTEVHVQFPACYAHPYRHVGRRGCAHCPTGMCHCCYLRCGAYTKFCLWIHPTNPHHQPAHRIRRDLTQLNSPPRVSCWPSARTRSIVVIALIVSQTLALNTSRIRSWDQ